MREIAIAIFDNEAAELDQMRFSLERLFSERKVPINIQTDLLPQKIEKIEALLKRSRPELVFFDNHIGAGANDSMYGQHVIAHLKPKFPDSIFILLSKEAVRKDSLDKQFPTPDLFASKLGLEMGYQGYCDWIFTEITGKLMRARIDVIDWRDCASSFSHLRSKAKSAPRRAIKEEEIRSLIEQACYTGGAPSENVIEEVKLKPLQGGFSGAVVTEIAVRNKYGAFNVPAVMKFMDRASAERESHNHAKFVKWVLPYRWRVDVIGRGNTDEFGCVTYSFAHGGTGSPETLSSLISKGENSRVKSVMQAVFDPESQAWYSNDRMVQSPLGVYLAKTAPYSLRVEDGMNKEDELVDLIKSIIPEAEGSVINVGGISIVSIGGVNIPVTAVRADLAGRREITTTIECLSHGDLNSGNILVRKESEEFCFIDFQHTGWHHRAMDFCSFEGSLRTLMREVEVRSFSVRVTDEFEGWNRMEDRRWVESGPMMLVDELRRLFLENHDASTQEFALASAFHTLWLLGFESWNEFQRRRLLAFFLGTLRWLQMTKVIPK